MAKYIKADITPIIENMSKCTVHHDCMRCGEFFITKNSFNGLSIFISGPDGETVIIDPSGDIQKLTTIYDVCMVMKSRECLAQEAVDNAFKRLIS